jgi:hypothetical protein
MFIYLFNNVLPNKNQGQNNKVPAKRVRACLNIVYKQCQLNSIQTLWPIKLKYINIPTIIDDNYKAAFQCHVGDQNGFFKRLRLGKASLFEPEYGIRLGVISYIIIITFSYSIQVAILS